MWQDFLFLMKAELLIIAIIFLLLFMQLAGRSQGRPGLLVFINILLAINLAAGFVAIPEGTLFGDMFRTNELITMEKNFLNLATLIISLQSWHWLKGHDHVIEFYLLLLSTLVGMFYMISSSNLLMFYLGLELSTIPLAALSNFDLQKRRSSEAAFKFIISSAFSSGLLLFGISLIYGATGTLNFTALAQTLQNVPLVVLGSILFLAGFAFKISAVPFHLWTADVYEGSPVPVTSYLSVVSKGAVLFVLITILYNVIVPLGDLGYYMVFILAVVTMVIGNLFALRQRNMKRFLAFSSIAQVGFILVGLTSNAGQGSAAVIYFILVYIFSNLGAFGVVSIISSLTGREDMEDYKGFYRTNPGLSWVLAISLFSLAGVPPMAGFFGKYFLLFAGASNGSYVLLIIASLNIVISLFYYLKVVRAIFMDPNDRPIETVRSGLAAKLSMLICVGGILVTGLFSGAYNYIYSLVK
jgi:NADH-quinone oxidoreductase subunit N